MTISNVLPIRGFAGDVLMPEDPAYDDARRLHNAAIDRRPALIARCADERDVVGVAEDAILLGRRDAAWHWQAGTAWFESADDDRSRAWIASVGEALAPWSAGESDPNFIVDTDPERLRAAYAPAVFDRLQAIRADSDPDGVFAATLERV